MCLSATYICWHVLVACMGWMRLAYALCMCDSGGMLEKGFLGCMFFAQISEFHFFLCCFYYFLRNSLVALLEALFANIGACWHSRNDNFMHRSCLYAQFYSRVKTHLHAYNRVDIHTYQFNLFCKPIYLHICILTYTFKR